MKRFRTSFSILNAWASGNKEGAIDMFFKRNLIKTEQMSDGIVFHDKWATHILKNKEIPQELSSKPIKLIDPRPELKLEIDLGDNFQFVGIIDCLDGETIYEFKTGRSNSSDYANGKQIDCYAYLLSKLGIKTTKGIYLHYNQYDQRADKSLVYLTDNRLKTAEKWILDYTSDMYDYLVKTKQL